MVYNDIFIQKVDESHRKINNKINIQFLQKIVFFGDAMTNNYVKKACSIPFIGIINEDTEFPEETILINGFTTI